MRKLLAALAVLATVGCDDSTVHSLITSNFVCVYMPYWMGECDSTEMQDKAQSVLNDGLVSGQVTCEVTPFVPSGQASPACTGITHHFKISVTRFQEGTGFLSIYDGSGLKFSDFTRRSQELSAVVVNPDFVYGSLKFTVGEGTLDLDWSDYYANSCSPGNASATQQFSYDLQEDCVGHNLAAFGVEE